MSPRDRGRRAKRADRARAGTSRPAPEDDPELGGTGLAETDEELRAEVDAAADELRDSGVAQRIAAGDAGAAQPRADTLSTTAQDAAAARVGERPSPARTGATGTTLPYVDDRVSKVWVALIAIAFAGVFAYAFLGGKGGYLTRTPSPSPSPSATASPSASATASATGSPAATASP